MSALADLPLIASGKVREMYELDPARPDRLLMVASDRISTYDAVHPTPIPDKGNVLTGLSAFWFTQTRQIVANHMLSATEGVPAEARGRALVVRRLKMLPVECVVRGYITGSGWSDYKATGRVSGIELPAGLRESERLPEPIFTPSTKADVGHDEAIDFERAAELVGDRGLMERVRDISIALYSFAAEHARSKGVILADTKFELGLDEDGELVVGDEVLTGLSVFWFQKTKGIVANHLISATDGVPEEARGRALVVRKLEMLPVECVVRGYITGSGWKDYQATGAVSGIELPAGLRESERLPEPIFTPSTKADVGHDETIDFARATELVGDRGLMEKVRDKSIELYSFAAAHARERGVILADTKFEFGLGDDELVIGDEVLTPDSSRYWPVEGYEVGRGQPSFDKQYVRDWASGSGWDKRPPAPAIPGDVVRETRARYIEAYELITGEPFSAWLERTRSGGGSDGAETDGRAVAG